MVVAYFNFSDNQSLKIWIRPELEISKVTFWLRTVRL